MVFLPTNTFHATFRIASRKNLAGHTALTTIYGLMLVGAGFIAWFEINRAGFNTVRAVSFIANIACVLRTSPRLPVLRIVQDNKYLLWISMYLLLEKIRPHLNEPIIWQAMLVNQSSAMAVIALGVYKHYKSKREQQTKPAVKFV